MGTKHPMPTFRPRQVIYGTIGQSLITSTDSESQLNWIYLLLLKEDGSSAAATISGTLTSIIYKTAGGNNKGKFKVFRDDGTNYDHIWTGPEVTLVTGAGSITGLSVAVQLGDYLAFYQTSGATICKVAKANAVKYYNTPTVDLQIDTPKTSWSSWGSSMSYGGIIEG